MHSEGTIEMLIIDDNQDDAIILSRYLGRCDKHRIETGYAPDLQTALKKLNDRHFDLIFLDNTLGAGTSARDVLETFRAESIDVPVIIFTGQADRKTAIELMKNGAYDCVTKNDLSIEMLEKTIFNTIERHTLKKRQAENEQALKSLNEKLRDLVEKLTASNKELADFAHIVAHDLKSPLRAIGTLVDWIVTDYADKFDQKGRENINLLAERAKRMDNLIDGILRYAKVGRVNNQKQQVDLNLLLSDLMAEIDPPDNIRITIENPLPTITCAKTPIHQVFQNLLSNAVKYIDKPQGQIKINCQQEENCWKFSVSDNGPGIEKQHFEKIFKIFQTLSPKDENESTGIGLSIAKKIIESGGGRIWLESQPGKGSTFFFTLPKQSMGVENERYQANITS